MFSVDSELPEGPGQAGFAHHCVRSLAECLEYSSLHPPKQFLNERIKV